MESFGSLLEGFRRYMQVRNYSPRSVEHFVTMLTAFFEYLKAQGVGDIRRVGKPLLRGYQAALHEWRNAEGKPYSWATRAAKLQAVRRLFEWLEEVGKILVNPAVGLEEEKGGDRLPRNVLTEKQVERMLEGVDLSRPQGLRDRAILEVFYSTGIRLGEMAALSLGDIDLVSGAVRVTQGKGAKDRVVPLGKEAARWVREYAVKGRRFFTAKGKAKGKTRALWVNQWGDPLSGLLIQQMVKFYGAKAGLVVTAHALRHTFATQLVRNGAPVEAVAKMLGHSDLRVTHKYTRVAGVDLKRTQEATHPRERDEMEKAKVEITGIRGRYAQDRGEAGP